MVNLYIFAGSILLAFNGGFLAGAWWATRGRP